MKNKREFYADFFTIVSDFDDTSYGSDSERRLCDWEDKPDKRTRQYRKDRLEDLNDIADEVSVLDFY